MPSLASLAGPAPAPSLDGVAAALWSWPAHSAGPWWAALGPFAYVAAMSVPLAVADLRTYRLPNALVVPGLVMLAWAIAAMGLASPPAVLPLLAGAALAAALLAAAWAAGAVGMGDVKLGLLLGGTLGALAGTAPPGTGGASSTPVITRAVGSMVGAPAVGGLSGGVGGSGVEMVGVSAGMEALLGLLVGAGWVAAVVVGAQVLAMMASGVPVWSARLPLGPALLLGFWYAAIRHLTHA